MPTRGASRRSWESSTRSQGKSRRESRGEPKVLFTRQYRSPPVRLPRNRAIERLGMCGLAVIGGAGNATCGLAGSLAGSLSGSLPCWRPGGTLRQCNFGKGTKT
jgi:hypothetical protein